MPLSTLKGKVVDAKLWIPIEDVESSALDQLRNIASLPWVAHVSVMPDVHFGKGATVGSVIAMRGAVSPAAVGVDIGCGMGAIKTNLKADQLPDSLKELRSRIESLIPVGFNTHPDTTSHLNLPGLSGMALKKDIKDLFDEYKQLDNCVAGEEGRAQKQLGTLGGGNHFIEVSLDTDNNVWLVLHSGSRKMGEALAKTHMARAKELGHNVGLPDRDLAVFLANTPEMELYRKDLFWAQRYAMLNRRTMFELFKGAMTEFFPNIKFEDPILCHHNYVSEETHYGEGLIVTRKGAISAAKGQLGIIPGSMGTKSYIVKGLGNPESLNSASHGAGRKMSRTAANKTFSEADLVAQTAGVECRKDKGVVDEIPASYKNIEQVMKNQSDLVEVVAEMKQVLCVKG